jgi:RNA-directed DNA polymerase
MSLTTPEKIRTLQRKLYCKTKAEPAFRFYLLYDKICREDILAHAYALARANGGAPGVDGTTFGQIEAAGLDGGLAGLRKNLVARTYRPAPVRRVMIPKPGGGARPLGIPTIRDRVVQTAAKLVLEPIFEADLDPAAHGYRPGRSGTDAIQAVHALLCRGYTDVVDADLSQYFDTIPHQDLMRSIARRIVDRHVLRLIKLWLEAPVEERDADGIRRLTGGKGSRQGTPQGGVISPLLANLYMNRFLKHWRGTGQGDAYHAQIVAYADAIRDARRERFDFLGYSFGPHRYRKDGHWYLGASPSKKSVQRLKTKVSDLLVPGNLGAWPDVRDRLNRLLRGWSAYFGYGTRLPAYRAIDNHVYDRVRHFLVRRHKVSSRGTKRFPAEAIFGALGVLRLRRVHLSAPPCALQ